MSGEKQGGRHLVFEFKAKQRVELSAVAVKSAIFEVALVQRLRAVHVDACRPCAIHTTLPLNRERAREPTQTKQLAMAIP